MSQEGGIQEPLQFTYGFIYSPLINEGACILNFRWVTRVASIFPSPAQTVQIDSRHHGGQD